MSGLGGLTSGNGSRTVGGEHFLREGARLGDVFPAHGLILHEPITEVERFDLELAQCLLDVVVRSGVVPRSAAHWITLPVSRSRSPTVVEGCPLDAASRRHDV